MRQKLCCALEGIQGPGPNHDETKTEDEQIILTIRNVHRVSSPCLPVCTAEGSRAGDISASVAPEILNELSDWLPVVLNAQVE